MLYLTLIFLVLLQGKKHDHQEKIWTLGGQRKMSGSVSCVRSMAMQNQV